LHDADDGALARVRIPGGLLSSAQALALADIADELGDGHLDLTSRGNVQLRGLASTAGSQLATRLHVAGLLPSDTHERVRNIVASPLGPEQVRQWTRELDEKLCGSPKMAALSGRFLFACDDGSGDVAALDADITLLGDRVRLGRSELAFPTEDPVRTAFELASNFVDLATQSTTRAWRVWEVEGLPVGTVPLELPGTTSPAGGELSVGTRFGRARAEHWRLLARSDLRVTPWRGVIVVDPTKVRAAELEAVGFLIGPPTAWTGATACTGLPGCVKSLADVRLDAARALELAVPGKPVHWSGCARRCGHPSGAWVDVVSTGSGYRIDEVIATTEEMASAVAAARRI
jgi:precorrin-3B synthase